MKDKKSFFALLILGVALLVLIGLIFINGGFSKNGESNLSAVRKAIDDFPYLRIGALAKVEPAGEGFPLVSIKQLESSEYTDTTSSCLGKELMERYGGSLYSDSLNKRARCLSGGSLATLYLGFLHDAEASVVKITTMLNALEKTMNNLNNLSKEKGTTNDFNVEGGALHLIPGGVNTLKSYPFVHGVSMKCIRDRATREPLINEVGVGTITKQYGQVFEETNDALNADLLELKEKNKEIGDKMAENSDLSIRDIVGIINNMRGVKDKMEGNFIPILGEDLFYSYPHLRQISVSVGINLEVDVNGNPIKSEVPVLIRSLIAAFSPHIGWRDDYFLSYISVDGVAYETPLPIEGMVKEMKSQTQKHIIRLKRMKEDYETKKIPRYKKILQYLEDKGYNCVKVPF